MASKPHYKRILVASGVSERKPGRIIRGFERITILLKPLNKSYRLPLKLLPIVRKLDRKRLQRPCLAIILVFPVVILFKVQVVQYLTLLILENYLKFMGPSPAYEKSIEKSLDTGAVPLGCG